MNYVKENKYNKQYAKGRFEIYSSLGDICFQKRGTFLEKSNITK